MRSGLVAGSYSWWALSLLLWNTTAAPWSLGNNKEPLLYFIFLMKGPGWEDNSASSVPATQTWNLMCRSQESTSKKLNILSMYQCVTHTYSPITVRGGSRERRILGAHDLGSFTWSVSSRFKERLCLKNHSRGPERRNHFLGLLSLLLSVSVGV